MDHGSPRSLLPSSLVLMQMCPQPTPLLLSRPLPHKGRGAAPPSQESLRLFNPGNLACQPMPRQQVRASCLQIWVWDWSLAVGVPYAGTPTPGTRTNTLYTLTAVLDALRVLELKEEPHLTKQAKSYPKRQRGCGSWWRAVGTPQPVEGMGLSPHQDSSVVYMSHTRK